MLRFYLQKFHFLSGLLKTRAMLTRHCLHVLGIVTIGEEKKVCTVSENFLRMCESTEVRFLQPSIWWEFLLPCVV